MKNKFIHVIVKRSNNIVKYVFWSYFLFVIGYYYLYNDAIPVLMVYLFWFLLGIRLGYLLAVKAADSSKE